MLIVTNINLFAASFLSLWDTSANTVSDSRPRTTREAKDISSLLDEHVDDPEVEALLADTGYTSIDNSTVIDAQETFLRARIKEYPFDFNTLPPVNKLMIPSLGVDIPIIEPKTMSAENFLKANYDEELKQ